MTSSKAAREPDFIPFRGRVRVGSGVVPGQLPKKCLTVRRRSPMLDSPTILGGSRVADDLTDPSAVSALRSVAHPVRLRILSLLTAEAMSAAEVARALGL